MRNVSRKVVLLLAISTFSIISACKKDKVPGPTPTPELTKWEKVVGDYKVYDTMGIYLYDMGISHNSGIDDDGFPYDSLHFENFDGQFNISARQSNASNYHNSVVIGVQTALVDSSGNRWKVSSVYDEVYNNLFNDTIRFRFWKHNLNYYLEDLVPYYDCQCKQVAVKQ
jgi:hypothetical protein